jgi:uncharacterized protein YfiM (DUF2279 family)
MRKSARRRSAVLGTALALGFGLVNAASASGFQLFFSTDVLAAWESSPQAPPSFSLGDSGLVAAAEIDLREAARSFQASPTPEPAPRKPLMFPGASAKTDRLLVGIVSAGAIAGSAYNAFSDKPSAPYHFTNEGYFGRHTYEGGGDKASHFVSYYAVSRLLAGVYETLDQSEQRSYTLASGVSALAGLATEIGDGTNRYGFSYEDLILDTAGAASAYVLARYKLNDLIVFRAGIVPAPETPLEFYDPSIGGKDYTKEIYTADLKFSGLSRRMDRRFGLARFLLFGLTYGVKGYPNALEDLRQRQVGIELGLDLSEIARCLGVPEDRWWGKLALIILDVIRIPYTSIGVQYDINHGKWYGPSIGDDFQFPGQ